MLGLAVVFAALGVLFFIYGDPVRGPFTYLIRPHAKDKITFHAGLHTEVPYKKIADGYDFTQFIRFNQPQSGEQPLRLWIQKTWPWGWHVKATLFAGKDTPALIFDDKEIKYIMPGADVNYDENAIEFVMPPIGNYATFQLIFAADDNIYVNAMLGNPQEANIMNGDELFVGPISAVKPSDLPKRIFKYPSYAHRGQRE